MFLAFGHRLARDGLRGALAQALRALAALARVGTEAAREATRLGLARGYRWSVYAALTQTLALDDEAAFEAGAGGPEVTALRARVLAATNRALGVMLALLAVVRHRLAVPLPFAPEAHERVHALAAGIVATFDGLADRLEGRPRPGAPMPDLTGLLDRAWALRDDAAVTGAHVQARLALYRALVEAMLPLARDVEALAAPAHLVRAGQLSPAALRA